LNCKSKAGLSRASIVLAILVCSSCRAIRPPPPIDFSAPGWRIQQGQAVWKPSSHRPELAGDLLLATNRDGNFLVQFTKTPFPFATAEVMDGCWQIEFGVDEYSRQGHGRPPVRFVWFQLPRALLEGKTAGAWQFESRTTNSWQLRNPRTGEILEGEFFP
jgi:hypothetical protein